MSSLLAAIYDRFMRRAEQAGLRAWRRELLADLDGVVLEVGAGTGANLLLYPPAVTRIVLTEPDPAMRRRLRRAVRRARDPRAVVSPAPADALPADDGSLDAVVATLVLCSVPDPASALREIRRVLRPGGRLVFLEHVAATDRPDRFTWQRRIEPFWSPLTGNCHLTRRTEEEIVAAGFVIERVASESMRKALPWLRPSVRGVATRARDVRRPTEVLPGAVLPAAH